MMSCKEPLTCTLCGTVWDPAVTLIPTCSHTEAEWEAHWAAAGDRRQWHPIDNPGVPPSEEVQQARARARLNAAPQDSTAPQDSK
jgi:hypothetical protein